MNKEWIAQKLGYEDWEALTITFVPYFDGTDEDVFLEEVEARNPNGSREDNMMIADFILREVTK